MYAEFPRHAAECGQPRKCVLQWPETRRRGRKESFVVHDLLRQS